MRFHQTAGTFKLVMLLGLAACLPGCAATQETWNNPEPADAEADVDPAEPVNRAFYKINETLDGLLVKPMAELYVMAAPEFLRDRVTNFFDNLFYLNVALNSFLQGKLDQGLSDTTRIVFNTMIGLGGTFDVATPMGLPRHEEDFGQTLAIWGFGQGVYVYLPVYGPNTVRDVPDIATSTLTNPLFYVSTAIAGPLGALSLISERANLLEATRIRDEAAVDPYIFTREAYLQRRQYLIYDGHPPPEGYEDIFEQTTGQPDEGILEIR
jgi:phospholipid-binding lipoprotein MlaA